MATYLRIEQRKALARGAAMELLREGTAFHQLTLRSVAEHLGWPLGTLHRAYSVMATLLHDLVLEYEQDALRAVFAIREDGLAAELAGRAERWHAWLADPAHEQMVRYEMDLVCRSESPLAQALPHARTDSEHFHRRLLADLTGRTGEEYRDPDLLAAMVAGMHDGLTYSYLEHGDLDRLRTELLAVVPLLVSFAQPSRGVHRRQ